MASASQNDRTLQEWIAAEAVPFAFETPDAFERAVDRVVAQLGDQVHLLGMGEPLHGSETILRIRNRVFERLVSDHGYSAIALESSFPRGRLVDGFINGGGPETYDAIEASGFSHGFGRSAANRAIVEWMRHYNADASHTTKLSFYGFDGPTEMTGTDSPRPSLHVASDFLASVDEQSAKARRARIDSLLGDDAAWENPAAMMDPSKSIGLSAEACALRIEAEELQAELLRRRPECVQRCGVRAHLNGLQHASIARQLLTYHAALARPADDRIAVLLGIRDLMMADNLAHAVASERGRGKVFAFAHNSHLQRGPASWQLGPHALTWWPAGAHVHETMGDRYANVCVALGRAEALQITEMPDAGSLEALLCAAPGPARFVATRSGDGLPIIQMTRSRSAANPGYFPLTGRLTDFDVILSIDDLGG